MSEPAPQVKSRVLRGPKSFDPKVFLRPGCTEEDIIELKEAFDTFDLDCSGAIDSKELKNILETFGLDSKNAAIAELTSELDKDNSGKIEFTEFLNLVVGSSQDSKEEVQKVFKIFDKENSGFISFESLKVLVTDLGLQMSDSTLKNLIAKGDSDSDSRVTFDDFYQIMTKTVA